MTPAESLLAIYKDSIPGEGFPPAGFDEGFIAGFNARDKQQAEMLAHMVATAKHIRYKWGKLIAAKLYDETVAEFTPEELQELIEDIESISTYKPALSSIISSPIS